MRLEKLLIINRAPFEHLEMEFENENIVLLSGINGAGKTTIISYVVDAFYELAKKGFRNEFEYDNKFYRVSSSMFSLDGLKPSIVYFRFLKEAGGFEDYIDIRNNCSQAQYESLIAIDNRIPYSKFGKVLENNNVAKYWTLSDKKAIESLFNTSLLTYFPAYRYETPYYLNDPYKIILDFKKDMSFSGYLKNPIEVTSDLPNIANWIMDFILDNLNYKDEEIIFDELNDIVTNILFCKAQCRTRVGIGKRFSGANRVSIVTRDGEVRKIYPSIFNMSSGELALLCLFVELLKQSDKIQMDIKEVTGVVLVDEIEKHLHIKLQKEVLPVLIAMFPKVQFIASSHSPFFSLGLYESNVTTYKIFDLDNGGHPCLPQDNDIFREVYNSMISENERYAAKYKELEEQMSKSSRPLVITEGKTDWKHLKAAMRALSITGLDFDFYEYEDLLGDTVLLRMLNDYSRILQQRKVIGVFDRDNFNNLKCEGLKSQKYIDFGNNVYAFAIPLVNEEEYGRDISIEHYYKRVDLTKFDPNGRRLFLGDEFFESGISKDRKYHTRISQVGNKVAKNGIIDDKVYEVEVDPEEKHSIALSKNDFANLVLESSVYSSAFDFSEFEKIFAIIREIIK